MEVEHYREVVDRIRARNSEVIINLTTGPGGRFHPSEGDPSLAGPRTNLLVPERRVQHVLALRPDICTLDLNTMVFGGEVVINTPSSIEKMAAMIYEATKSRRSAAKPSRPTFAISAFAAGPGRIIFARWPRRWVAARPPAVSRPTCPSTTRLGPTLGSSPKIENMLRACEAIACLRLHDARIERSLQLPASSPLRPKAPRRPQPRPLTLHRRCQTAPMSSHRISRRALTARQIPWFGSTLSRTFIT